MTDKRINRCVARWKEIRARDEIRDASEQFIEHRRNGAYSRGATFRRDFDQRSTGCPSSRWRHGRPDIRHGARLTSALFLTRQPSCRLKRIRKVPLNNLRKLRRRRRVDLVEKLRRRSGPKEKYVTS